jgi:hypothetical protein
MDEKIFIINIDNLIIENDKVDLNIVEKIKLINREYYVGLISLRIEEYFLINELKLYEHCDYHKCTNMDLLSLINITKEAILNNNNNNINKIYYLDKNIDNINKVDLDNNIITIYLKKNSDINKIELKKIEIQEIENV